MFLHYEVDLTAGKRVLSLRGQPSEWSVVKSLHILNCSQPTYLNIGVCGYPTTVWTQVLSGVAAGLLQLYAFS